MGHFLPMMHIAEELKDRGHDVTVISNEYGGERIKNIIEEAGCTAAITKDGISKEEMRPGDRKLNPGGSTGYNKWLPILKEEIHKVKPDIAVLDFFTVPAFKACDELGIKVVSNFTYPLEILNIFGPHHYPQSGNTSNCCGFLCIR